jgi:hypothetical protein
MRAPWLIRTIATVAMFGGILASASARAERTIASILVVSKSENKNQVHYGVHLDESCSFASGNPVYAYWRMLERSPSALEPLLEREQRAYGIEHQEIHGDTVRFTLRALRTRAITVRVTRAPDGACNASLEAAVAGRAVRLYNIHVALGFLRVDHLLLTGWSEQEKRVVSERIEP